MFRYIATLSLLIMFASCAPEGARELSTDEIDQIKTTMQAYRQAWIDNDTATVMGTISDDIILFLPGTTSKNIEGKSNVRNFWFPPSDIQYPIRKYEITDEEIFGSGQYATAQGKSLLIWETMKGDSVVASDTSKSYYLTILKKNDGTWKILRQMFQSKE
jgi:ketosteroid isomerase-like protein